MKEIIVAVVQNWGTSAEGVTAIVASVVAGLCSIIAAIAAAVKLVNREKCTHTHNDDPKKNENELKKINKEIKRLKKELNNPPPARPADGVEYETKR